MRLRGGKDKFKHLGCTRALATLLPFGSDHDVSAFRIVLDDDGVPHLLRWGLAFGCGLGEAGEVGIVADFSAGNGDEGE